MRAGARTSGSTTPSVSRLINAMLGSEGCSAREVGWLFGVVIWSGGLLGKSLLPMRLLLLLRSMGVVELADPPDPIVTAEAAGGGSVSGEGERDGVGACWAKGAE
jgi:hypothetical protein